MADSLVQLRERGRAAFASRNYEEAVHIYTDAIKQDSSYPVWYSNRAMAYIKLSDYIDALEDCQRGLSMCLDDEASKTKVKLLWRKSTCELQLGQLENAESTLEEAEKIDPSNAAVKRDLVAVRGKQKRSQTKKRKIDMQKSPQNLVELAVEDVDVLPGGLSVFSESGKHSSLNPAKDVDSIDLDSMLGDIDGVVVPKPKQPEQVKSADTVAESSSPTAPDPFLFPPNPTVYFLSTIGSKLTDSNRTQYYEYILGICSSVYRSLFGKTGVDQDFLNFFVDAGLWDLQRQAPQYITNMAEDIREFASMPRFAITTMYVSSQKSSQLLDLLQQKGNIDLHSKWI